MAGIDGVKVLDGKMERTQKGYEDLWQVVREKYEKYRNAFKTSQNKASEVLSNPFNKPDIGNVNKTLDTKLKGVFSSAEKKDALDIANNATDEIEQAIQALWNKDLAKNYIASISSQSTIPNQEIASGLTKINNGGDMSAQAGANNMKTYNDRQKATLDAIWNS
jgi:hypothetical protein